MGACSPAVNKIYTEGYTMRQALSKCWRDDVLWLLDELKLRLPEAEMRQKALAFSNVMLTKRLSKRHRMAIKKNICVLDDARTFTASDLFNETSTDVSDCGLFLCPKSVKRFEAKLFRRYVLSMYDDIKLKMVRATT